MSRSGYTEDFDNNWDLIRWRGRVASATRGKRGQKLLRDMLAALDAMPAKRLVREELETPDGDVCALGALGRVRKLAMADLDPEDSGGIASLFDIAEPLAREIVYMNDEFFDRDWDWENRKLVDMTPEARWEKMRAWVAEQIKS